MNRVFIVRHAAAVEGASFSSTHAYFGCLEMRPIYDTALRAAYEWHKPLRFGVENLPDAMLNSLARQEAATVAPLARLERTSPWTKKKTSMNRGRLALPAPLAGVN